MATSNKLHVYAGTSQNVMAESDSYTEYEEGAKAGETISSKKLNTAIRASSLVAKALITALTKEQTTSAISHLTAESTLVQWIKDGLAQTKVNNAVQADNATKVNNLTVEKAVPADAKFTDTTYSIGTSSVAGLVKSSTTGTTSGKDYAVEIKSDGTMKVNVPWTETTVNNTLTSTSTTEALSAAQGKVLADKIANLGFSYGVVSFIKDIINDPVMATVAGIVSNSVIKIGNILVIDINWTGSGNYYLSMPYQFSSEDFNKTNVAPASYMCYYHRHSDSYFTTYYIGAFGEISTSTGTTFPQLRQVTSPGYIRSCIILDKSGNPSSYMNLDWINDDVPKTVYELEVDKSNNTESVRSKITVRYNKIVKIFNIVLIYFQIESSATSGARCPILRVPEAIRPTSNQDIVLTLSVSTGSGETLCVLKPDGYFYRKSDNARLDTISFFKTSDRFASYGREFYYLYDVDRSQRVIPAFLKPPTFSKIQVDSSTINVYIHNTNSFSVRMYYKRYGTTYQFITVSANSKQLIYLAVTTSDYYWGYAFDSSTNRYSSINTRSLSNKE